jgi:hypothetical protein
LGLPAAVPLGVEFDWLANTTGHTGSPHRVAVCTIGV